MQSRREFNHQENSISFSLSKNGLKDVPTSQIFSVRNSLEFLDLTQTEISGIPKYAFQGQTNLQKLILNNLPRLRKIDALAFSDLRSLDVFECQKNKKLEYIDPYAFYNDFIEEK